MTKEQLMKQICNLPDGAWLTEEEAYNGGAPIFIMLVKKRIWLQEQLNKFDENLTRKN